MRAKEFISLMEYINKDVMSLGFSDEQSVLDNKFIIKAETISGSDPDFAGIPLPKFKMLAIEVVDAQNPEKVVATAKFKMHGALWWKNLQAKMINVVPDYRRQGIATAVYQYVSKLGNTIKPSNVQLTPGQEMWKGFKRKHSLDESGMAEDHTFADTGDAWVNGEKDAMNFRPKNVEKYHLRHKYRSHYSDGYNVGLKRRDRSINPETGKPYIKFGPNGPITPEQGVAEGSESLDYQGNCTEDDVVDDIFGDVNNFANMVEKYGDEFTRGNLVVKYDPKKDVHYFYYKKQGVAENFADGKNPQDRGDSARHGIPKHATIAQLEKIRSSKTASPRKKQLAHWQINMRRGQAKK